MLKYRLEALISEMNDGGFAYGEAIHEFKKIFVSRVLQQCGGNQVRAAKRLGVHRNTLGRILSQYKIDTRAARKAAGSMRSRAAALPRTG
jgi:DNA-binding protein Fis